jgi:cellulose synthase/poly-beta-1,6-N-acetylglucosamine synthase-like glycosyltransferase
MRARVHHFATDRLGEIILPILTYLIITLPIWLSPFHPAVVAYFIISFELYFFYKSITTCFNATVSYRKIQMASRISFVKKLKKTPGGDDIHHFIIIPNYKEPIYKIESTIRSITSNDYPYKKLYLVLAFEKREAEAREKEAMLRDMFKNDFKDIIVSYHVLTEEEVPGKASNQTYAAKVVEKYITKNNLDEEKSILTICDADSYMPHNYFSYLTYEFLLDDGRKYHFYWAPVLLQTALPIYPSHT